LVLDRRVCTKSRRTYYQLLIKWTNWPPELAMWEGEDEILRLFPKFTSWGQDVAKGGGMSQSKSRAQNQASRASEPRSSTRGLLGQTRRSKEGQAQLCLEYCCETTVTSI
jgi:hypothetical protein